MALKMEDTVDSDTVQVSGRGLLHLTVLIENMRREGFELMVGPPKVIEKKVRPRRARTCTGTGTGLGTRTRARARAHSRTHTSRRPRT